MFLAQRERRLYQQMAQYRPELIIRLGIDIDTAISRKPDHDYAELQDKIGVMSTIGYNGTKILEIDSRAPYSEVLEQAQKAVSLVAIVSDRRSFNLRLAGYFFTINDKVRLNWRVLTSNIGLQMARFAPLFAIAPG